MDLYERIDYFGINVCKKIIKLKPATKPIVENELKLCLNNYTDVLWHCICCCPGFENYSDDDIYAFIHSLILKATENHDIQSIALLVWKNYDIATQSNENIDWETVDELKVIWIDAIKDTILFNLNIL
jgi:hypothetical protein